MSLENKHKITFSTHVALESIYEGKKIHGMLAIPRFSINGRAYLPEELARGHGKVVPVFSEHSWKTAKSASDRKPVGQMALTWDGPKQQLLFDALITDEEFAAYVEKNKEHLGASLGVIFEQFDRLCGTDRCYVVPRQMEFIEGSIVAHPSMPETAGTLVVLESIEFADGHVEGEHCPHCKGKLNSAKPKEGKATYSVAFDSKIATFAEEAGKLKVTGVLAVPRVNLNGSLLLPQDLAQGHGLTIPMSINHRYSFDESIPVDGSMTLRWNDDKLQLEYDGVVTSQEGIEGVKSGKYKHTSISIQFADFDYYMGFFVLKGIVRFVEGSLVENPAIPEATVVAVESLNSQLAGKNNLTEILKAILSTQFKLRPESFTPSAFRFSSFLSMLGDEIEKGVQKPAINSLYENPINPSQNMSASPQPQNDDASKTKGAAAAGAGGAKDSPAVTEIKMIAFEDAQKLLAEQGERYRVAIESISKIGDENARKIAEAILSAAPGARGAGDKPTASAVNRGAGGMQEKVREIRDRAILQTLKESGSVDPALVQRNMQAMFATEAVDLSAIGNVAGGYWTTDMTVIPDKITANLRQICDVKTLPKGAKTAHWTLMARPAFGALSPPTVPGDYDASALKIEDISADPLLRGVKQTITDQAVHGATTDLVGSIEMMFREAAEVDLDDLVITALDGIASGSLCGTVFGGDATTEGTVDASDTFAGKNILKAQQLMRSKGYTIMPGDTTVIIDPVQLYNLMLDTQVQNQFQYGVQSNNVSQVPMLYGSFIRVAPMKTGLGNPTTVTTYHGFLVLNTVAMGLAFSDELRIEAGRVVGELGTRLIASVDAVAKAKIPTSTGKKIAVVKIITS